MLSTVLFAAYLLFPVSEVALAIFKRAGQRRGGGDDRGSLRALWAAILTGVALALVLRLFTSAPLPMPAMWREALALGCLVGGLAVRWMAIITLGRFFTVDVAIRDDHALVDTGLYRLVRHPSYSGLLIAFAGVGLAYDNWFSLAGVLVPIALAVANRITKEERALLAALGDPYAAYCARTKRLFPGLF